MLFNTVVLISNITKDKTTYICSNNEPKSFSEMVEYEYFIVNIFQGIIHEKIEWTSDDMARVVIPLTNRQLNKMIWRLKHSINDDRIHPLAKAKNQQLLKILKPIR